jgi:cytochrome P450
VHWYAPLGAWLLTRYADVDAALRDARLSNTFGTALPASAQTAGGQTAAGCETRQAIYTFVANSLVFTDPPRHTRLRELVSKAFTPQTIDPLRPRIQALLDGLLAPLVAQGRFDLAHDRAYPFPLAVLALLLGFPQEDRDQIKRSCDEFLVPFGHGFHFCLGVALARLEGESFFGRLLQRCPSLARTTDQVQSVDNFYVRQVQALPVAV